MYTRYVNRARHLLTLELNSGEAIILAPNEVSREIEAYEITSNQKLEKLLRNRLIEAVAND